MKTQAYIQVTVSFNLLIDHAEGDEPDVAKIEQLAKEMTPEQWFNMYSAGELEVDVDVDNVPDDNNKEDADFFYRDESLVCADYYYEHGMDKEDAKKTKTKKKKSK